MEFLRRRAGLIIRAAISLLAIGWVVRTNDWHKVGMYAVTMDFRWLLLAVLCFLPTLMVVSWRWRLLLGVQGVHLRFWRVLELTMIGQFFSTVGVGTTGGDVFKIFYVTKAVPQRKAAVAFTVIVDRIIGLMALLLFGAALSVGRLPVLFSRPDTRAATATFYFFVFGGVIASVLACAGPYISQNLALRSFVKRLPFAHRGTSIFAAYENSARALGTNLTALLGSIPSHASITTMGYCILRAMHLQPDVLLFCAIFAIVNMLIALPVSISGIGVREKLFSVFFILLGYDKEHAVAFSLTYFGINLLWCLAGGPFYFLYRHETHAPAPNVAQVNPIFSE